jgi:hypothetical protein
MSEPPAAGVPGGGSPAGVVVAGGFPLSKENAKMKNVQPAFKAFSIVILILTFASLAHAAPPPTVAPTPVSRTWVSGVGDDTNPCSRTAPCKTFSGAIALTLTGGEIDALDPGDFGPVTITKSITIDGTQGAGFASITPPNFGFAITINAGPTDVVTLRNLSINGPKSSASSGIVVNTAGTVHIENCIVSSTEGNAIIDSRAGNANDIFYLYIKDTIATNSSADGIAIFPQNAGVFLIASLTNVRAQDNGSAGIAIISGVYASLDHCVVSGNRTDGFFAQGNSGGTEGNANAASMTVKNSVSSGNGNGITARPGTTVRISGVQVFNNTLGINLAGGTINSYGNNEIDGNTTDGAPSNAIPQK